MGEEELGDQYANILPPLSQRVRSPLDLDDSRAAAAMDNRSISDRAYSDLVEEFGYETAGRILSDHRASIRALANKPPQGEVSSDFMARICDKKLAKSGFPGKDSFLNKNVLVRIGDVEVIYEVRVKAVSVRGHSVFLVKTTNKKVRTVTDKMIGWWLTDKVTFIDKVCLDLEKDMVAEKDMTRNIL